MNPRPASSDFSLLDLESKTPEEWRAKLQNRIVQQKDILVEDFKKKVVHNITTCMQNVERDTSIESLNKRLTDVINENKFEFEYQKFIDGIVGVTFEYVCQFIIKNSMDNIKRTQIALNSISNSSNNNNEKSRCNENIQLQESSKLLQIQCLSGSNNTTTDSGKVIQSHLFNNCLQNNGNSLVIMGKKYLENTSINKIENTYGHNFKPKVESRLSNEVSPIENNYLQIANMSNTVEDDEEDVKTNQSIMSLALKISQQDINFNYSDDFDEQIINGNSSSFFVDQNRDQNVDTFKLDEEYKISNSLKILESLVNIEHDKLEIQKCYTENELKRPNIESFEKNQSKISNTTDLKKKESRKSKKKELEIVNKEKKKESKENKDKKRKTRKVKSSRSENTSFSSTNDETLAITRSIETPLASQNVKNNLQPYELKTLSDKVENITVNQKELNNTNTTNDSNVLSMNVSSIASTSSYNEKNIKSSKKTSSSISGSLMKTADYKKLYEKDRKSLFSPDIILTSKFSKNSSNNLSIQKEYKPLEIKDNVASIKKSKSQVSKLNINNNLSSNKKKVSLHNDNKTTIINGKRKEDKNSKFDFNSTSKFSSAQKPSQNTSVNSHNKFKRLRMHGPNDDIKTNSDNKNNKNRLSESSSNSENKTEINADTLEHPKLKKDESNTGTLENQSLPEWLRIKCELHKIKPVYVVINPNITY